MKKILLYAIAMLVSIASFAQKKGDMYVSGHFTADLGTYASVPSTGGSLSEWYAFDSSFDLGAEYGYFVADNLRLSLGVSFPIMSTPIDEMDGESYKYITTSFDIYPNLAYYVKMGEKCYFTPTFGLIYQRDKMKTKGTELYASSSLTSTWGAYLDILAFEFKVSEKFSIGINAGSIGAYSSNYVFSEDEKYKMNQFLFDFSHGSVDFKFYF
jgi:hypothetical protein